METEQVNKESVDPHQDKHDQKQAGTDQELAGNDQGKHEAEINLEYVEVHHQDLIHLGQQQALEQPLHQQRQENVGQEVNQGQQDH